MRKTDLVKLITRKAGVSDSSANEFFDIFLRDIAGEMELGESARFSNLGYFHYRRGKIKKQSDEKDAHKIENLDLIIFSPSSQLNIKSHDNVVFCIPETHDGVQETIDTHFSLSVGKPVLPQLEGKESTENADHPSEVDYRKFENKARNLIANLHIEESIKSDGEILLVDIRSIDSDQFELELNEEAIKKNSGKISESSIHSSEKLKTKAWDFGSILSKQIEEKEDSNSKAKTDTEKTRSENAKWDFGKRFWGNVPPSKNNPEVKSQVKEQEKPQETKTEIKEADEPDLSDELFDLEDDLLPDIEMDDFKIPDEQDKIGKFERVRSIHSSLKKEFKDIPGTEPEEEKTAESETDKPDNDEFYQQLKSKVGDYQKGDKNVEAETEDIEDNSLEMKAAETEMKLNRLEKRRDLRYERKNNSSLVIKIIAVLIIIVGGLYLLFKENGNGTVKEVVSKVKKNDNTTYVERNYDVPVTYPYDKKDDNREISGIDLTKEKDSAPEKNSDVATTDEKTGNNETGKNDINKKEQPVVTKPVEKTVVNKTVENNSNDGPVLIESNIYNYGEYYVVQISSFRSKPVAENTVSQYNSQGFKAFIETVDINGNDWYRVRVGNFKTLEEAQKFKNSNK